METESQKWHRWYMNIRESKLAKLHARRARLYAMGLTADGKPRKPIVGKRCTGCGAVSKVALCSCCHKLIEPDGPNVRKRRKMEDMPGRPERVAELTRRAELGLPLFPKRRQR
jgi:hypothetical protein